MSLKVRDLCVCIPLSVVVSNVFVSLFTYAVWWGLYNTQLVTKAPPFNIGLYLVCLPITVTIVFLYMYKSFSLK